MSYQALDAEIDGVRHQLDNLAELRYLTGLAATEEDRYQELCDSERALLEPQVGDLPDHRSERIG
jgi:hypothetical protein